MSDFDSDFAANYDDSSFYAMDYAYEATTGNSKSTYQGYNISYTINLPDAYLSCK